MDYSKKIRLKLKRDKQVSIRVNKDIFKKCMYNFKLNIRMGYNYYLGNTFQDLIEWLLVVYAKGGANIYNDFDKIAPYVYKDSGLSTPKPKLVKIYD